MLRRAPRHSVGLGVGYLPGPGARLFGLYEYRGLGPGAASFTLGWSEQLFGSAGYAFRFYLDPFADRQLSFGLHAFSEYTPDRLLNGPDGEETDERRTGARVRLELVLRPEREETFLSAHLEGQHARITLRHAEAPGEIVPLTTLDLGGIYVRGGGAAGPSVQLAPRLRLGLGRPLQMDWARAVLTGRLQYGLGRRFDLVVEARAALVSARTPPFERTSFGGMQGVRGFQQDAALGRRLWVLQNELWAPVPGTGGAEEGAAALLRQYVRLAGFFDVGGIYGTEEVEPGLRAGTGFGVRLLLGVPTLRLDGAYGFGKAEDARGHWYFSVGTQLPL